HAHQRRVAVAGMVITHELDQPPVRRIQPAAVTLGQGLGNFRKPLGGRAQKAFRIKINRLAAHIQTLPRLLHSRSTPALSRQSAAKASSWIGATPTGTRVVSGTRARS